MKTEVLFLFVKKTLLPLQCVRRKERDCPGNPLPLVRSRNRNDYYPYHLNWGLIPGLQHLLVKDILMVRGEPFLGAISLLTCENIPWSTVLVGPRMAVVPGPKVSTSLYL